MTPFDMPPVHTVAVPAEELGYGDITDDGQHVDDVEIWGDLVCYHVHTPSDDPDEDEERTCSPESRMRRIGDTVTVLARGL